MCENDRQIVSKDGRIPGVPFDCAFGEACRVFEKDRKKFVQCQRFGLDPSNGPVALGNSVCKFGLEEGCPLANAPANTPFEIVTKK
jgi:hypothetical protein